MARSTTICRCGCPSDDRIAPKNVCRDFSPRDEHFIDRRLVRLAAARDSGGAALALLLLALAVWSFAETLELLAATNPGKSFGRRCRTSRRNRALLC